MNIDCKGLMADLKAVQRANRQEVPLVDFVAGAHDQLCKLRVSQKLYGREDEVRRLTHNFELVCERSPMASTLALVHGYSGVLHSCFFILLPSASCFVDFIYVSSRLEKQYLYTKSTSLSQGDMDTMSAGSSTSSTLQAHF